MLSFNLRNFIFNGLQDAIGKMADYQVILNAAGWHEKGVLQEEDLDLLNTLIEQKNNLTPYTKPIIEPSFSEDALEEIIEEPAEE